MTLNRTPICSPDPAPHRSFTDAKAAVAELIRLYAQGTDYLRQAFQKAIEGGMPDSRFRAFYPEVRITTTSLVAPTAACLSAMSPSRDITPPPSPGPNCSEST